MSVPQIIHDLIQGLEFPGGTQTVGALADEHGNAISQRILSGNDGFAGSGGALRTDLPDKPHTWTAMLSDVESQAAAMLRHPSSPKRAVLVVSKDPCAGPKGCAENFQHLLPKGTVVEVWVARKDKPVRRWGSVVGTGRYLKQ